MEDFPNNTPYQRQNPALWPTWGFSREDSDIGDTGADLTFGQVSKKSELGGAGNCELGVSYGDDDEKSDDLLCGGNSLGRNTRDHRCDMLKVIPVPKVECWGRSRKVYTCKGESAANCEKSYDDDKSKCYYAREKYSIFDHCYRGAGRCNENRGVYGDHERRVSAGWEGVPQKCRRVRHEEKNKKPWGETHMEVWYLDI